MENTYELLGQNTSVRQESVKNLPLTQRNRIAIIRRGHRTLFDLFINKN